MKHIKIIIMLAGFLTIFSVSAFSQSLNPYEGQIKNVGAKLVLSGSWELEEPWSTNSNLHDKWWRNGNSYPPDNATFAHYENAVKNDVNPIVGQFTVEGPGKIIVYTKTRGSRIILYDRERKSSLGGYVHYNIGWSEKDKKWIDGKKGRDGYDPLDINRVGWPYPAGHTATYEVSIAASSYDNRIGSGHLLFWAPQSNDYKIWFVPFDGGKIISKPTNQFDKPQPGILYYKDKDCR